MLLRPPITLWLAILGDLFKLLGLTTTILVLAIALGAAVKPLSDGDLQPQDLPKFIAIAIVPMLAYTLPFAGGFAATLVYHRIAAENEAVAAHAGGISHRTLLAPAFITAVVLTCSLLVLTQHVIPAFLREMARMITIDVARQITHSVEKGQAVQLRGPAGGSAESRMMIYADQAQPVRPDPASGASDQITLLKFAAVELGKEGQPVTEVTSEVATLWLYPGNLLVVKSGKKEGEESRSLVFMRLENVAAVQQGKWSGGARDRVDLSWTVPNTFTEKPAFLSSGELKALKTSPERINSIESGRQRLANTLGERQAIASMQQAIANGQPITLSDATGHRLSLKAAGMTGGTGRWELVPPPGGRIEVEMVRGSVSGDSTATISAQRAQLFNDPSSGPHRLEFRLELEKARMREASAVGDVAAQTERAMIPITGLSPVPNPADSLLTMSTSQLLSQADQWMHSAPTDDLESAPKSMHDALAKLGKVVLSQQHERLAMAFSCLVTVLTGAMTALLLSRRLPLTVYLWTFFPAIASMVTIAGGQQVIAENGEAGMALMWSGVGGLGLYALVVFWRLAKH